MRDTVFGSSWEYGNRNVPEIIWKVEGNSPKEKKNGKAGFKGHKGVGRGNGQ